jgi:hypothetical protein
VPLPLTSLRDHAPAARFHSVIMALVLLQQQRPHDY